MKTGMVLEGGAMRGLFTAGVLDAMMAEGIVVDGVMGVSAGACIGANWITRQPGRALRYMKAYCRDQRFCSVRSLVQTGDLFGAQFCYHEIPNQLDPVNAAAYAENPTKFYVVCTDIETGETVYHTCKSMSDRELEWVRASASMPLASRIVKLSGRKLLDGGITDSIPLRKMEQLGYIRNIVVLTQPDGYRKTPNRSIAAVRMAYRKYPALMEAMENRHRMYNEQVKQVKAAETSGRAFVIRPANPLPIGRICHDPALIQQAYDLGRQAAQQRMQALHTFLGT